MTDEKCLDVILRTARTHNVFTDRPVSDATLRQAHELMKWGPTSANSQPGRFVFVRSRQAKEKLRPALSETNRDKTMLAPLTAIVAYDTRFYEHLPRMFHNPAAIDWFRGEDKKALAEITAFRNGRCRAPISSSRRARSAWTAARCPASTMRWWTRHFFPTAGGSRTSSSTWATASRRSSFRAIPG